MRVHDALHLEHGGASLRHVDASDAEPRPRLEFRLPQRRDGLSVDDQRGRARLRGEGVAVGLLALALERLAADVLAARARVLAGGGDRRVCLLYTSPSPRDQRGARMPSSA